MIKLEYLAHSSFLVTCDKTQLLFDPWLKGPAYSNQWYLWPLAHKLPGELFPDAILISHGHEDHLHTESLRAIHSAAHIFFPFQWRAGIKPYLKHLGFNKITEAISFHTYTLGEIKITYVGFSLESVIVIEYKNEVLVNINDALNSNHENAVTFLLHEINKRWPRIDYLLSGWSGAGYFPNQIRYPGKDDIETGKLREQYFANNFFRFSKALQPKYAVPFAPGFVLLNSRNRWINHIKFPREKAHEYYEQHFEKNNSISFLIPFPGDIIRNGQLEKKSLFHAMNDDQQYELAYKQYQKEMIAADLYKPVSEETIDALCKQLKYWMNISKALYHPLVLQDVVFSILLEDAPENTYLNIYMDDRELIVKKESQPLENRQILVRTSARMLLDGLQKEWGGDVLTIGYGILVEAYEQSTLEKNLDIVCIRLITRYPMAMKDLLKHPVRALKFYSFNPRLTSLWLKQKMRLKPYVNKFPFNERDHWITYNKCNLCAVCKMPEIDLTVYK